MRVEILVPELGESVLEATVLKWLKDEGDHVATGEALVELETDKVNLEVGAPQAGVLENINHQSGDDVEVGDVLGFLEAKQSDQSAPLESEPKPDVEDKAQTEAESAPLERKASSDVSATPVALRIAREQEIDLNAIRGTGPGGRITKGDIQQYVAQDEGIQPQRQIEASQPVQEHRREERVKLTRRRRTIAHRLVEAQQTAAMLTTFNEVDMSAVMSLRKRRNPDFQERHGVKLGIASFFIKAAVGALKVFPRLNAEIDGDEMVLKHYFDIGIAIGDEEGLVVPVLRDADRLSFAEIEMRIRDYVVATREKTLSLQDLRGGTFSITNGGVFGSLLSTPILNPPQVSILGLHKIEPRPIAVGAEIEIHPMMYLALSYDHRIVDGREAVQFLVRVKELVEDPERLLLEG